MEKCRVCSAIFYLLKLFLGAKAPATNGDEDNGLPR